MNKSVSGPAGDIVLSVTVGPVRSLFIYLFNYSRFDAN